MIAQINNSPFYALNYPVFVLLNLPMLKDMLNYIVPELILSEGLDISDDTIYYWLCLMSGTVL